MGTMQAVARQQNRRRGHTSARSSASLCGSVVPALSAGAAAWVGPAHPALTPHPELHQRWLALNTSQTASEKCTLHLLLLFILLTQEDEILRKRIKSYGLNNWGMVADGLPGRSGKSCSERWRIYLIPGVKRPTQEPFNEYEVAVIYLVRGLWPQQQQQSQPWHWAAPAPTASSWWRW